MTIRKYTARELAAGVVQVWSKGQYKIELARLVSKDTYWINVHDGRVHSGHGFNSLQNAHREFNRLVRYWEVEATIQSITDRLMPTQCPSYSIGSPVSNPNPHHNFVVDNMNGDIVCRYCGLLKGEV